MRHTKLSDQLFRCPILGIKSRLRLFLGSGQFTPQAHLEVDQKCTRHIEKQTRLQSPKSFKKNRNPSKKPNIPTKKSPKVLKKPENPKNP